MRPTTPPPPANPAANHDQPHPAPLATLNKRPLIRLFLRSASGWSTSADPKLSDRLPLGGPANTPAEIPTA